MMRRLALLAVAAAALTGCGVLVQPEPHPIEPPAGPFRAVASPQPVNTGSGRIMQTLYFVREDHLIAVTRRIDRAATVDELIRDLLAGPTRPELESGTTSALLGSEILAGWHVEDSVAVIELASGVTDTGRTDEVLALAQIVCTLTGHAEVTGVRFQRAGVVIPVPRGDGSVAEGPLTAADYQQYLAPTPTHSRS